jgi:hypothetical protein
MALEFRDMGRAHDGLVNDGPYRKPLRRAVLIEIHAPRHTVETAARLLDNDRLDDGNSLDDLRQLDGDEIDLCCV